MDKAIEILRDLISFRTDKNAEGHKACVDYICRILSDNGILFRRIPNIKGNLDNIIAGVNIREFKGVNTGLVLSGHMDTVGVNLKDWDSNPFMATNLDGCIYGRGTVDMKYFIAIILSILPELKKSGIPIFLLFSADEETDVEGISLLTSFLQMRNIQPKFALVGEPTNFELCVANKGYCGYTTIVKGVSAHSSRPDLGVNAIYAASCLVLEIEKLNARYMPFDTTLNVGVISGGVQRNSIPSEVMFDWEIRFSEEKHKQEILDEIKRIEAELSKSYSRLYVRHVVKENLPAFERHQESAIVNLTKKLLNKNVITMPVATEAGFLQRLGIDTLICGAGDMELAHSSSEYIKEADFIKYRDFLLQFVQEIRVMLD